MRNRRTLTAAGHKHGGEIIAASISENGAARFDVCDRCGTRATVVPTYYDGAGYCAACWVADIGECEDRWYTVTEHANIDPFRHRRAAAVYMAAVFAGIRAAILAAMDTVTAGDAYGAACIAAASVHGHPTADEYAATVRAIIAARFTIGGRS